MTEIYLIRHSLRDFSVQDDLDAPLTAEGKRGAEKLIKVFQKINIQQIFSSPYQRVTETLAPLAQAKNLEIQILPELKERIIGSWQEDFWNFAEKQWNDFDYKLENGESLHEVQKRNIKALQVVLSQVQFTDKIIIGTHGTALSTLINFYDQSFQFEQFKAISGLMPLVISLDFGENMKFLKWKIVWEPEN